MTPKEKAEDLFVRIYEYIPDYVIQENHIACGLAKQCALIAVDEIISNDEYLYLVEKKNTEYWKEVKQELEKL